MMFPRIASKRKRAMIGEVRNPSWRSGYVKKPM
jgi:hypothetical protein